MPKPMSADPAITDSYSLRKKQIEMVDELAGWMSADKSAVVREAIECLYQREAAKRKGAQQ